ncbi:MAG: fumarylacetoacetate hydrolase family protein [Pirellulaceae bacterium]|nr:fumarylacetoacetate hydrolase family protein [Pirellulaceae bacterium]
MQIDQTTLEQAARLLEVGRGQPPAPIGVLPVACQPQDVADAMAIQEVLHKRLVEAQHGRVVGTKIGCTTRVMQEYLGMEHPCSGGVFDSTVRHDDGDFDFDSFLHVGVECEIAAITGQVIRAADAPHDLASIMPAVVSVHAAIEVVDDRYVDFEQRVPDWRTWLADDFFGAGCVLGQPIRDWQCLDLPAVQGAMWINEEQVGTGLGRDIIHGHPLEALVWLANHEADRGRDLPANWMVMLGSVVQTKWLAKGDVVKVNIEGLGQAVARFV